jgi:dienelactone hydrolase
MKPHLNLGAMAVVAAALGHALIPADAGHAQGAASGQGSGANYELLTPRGAGPFPAVIVMHPCSGVTDNTRRWAGRLVGWGYAALIVDSFRSRGLSNVCGNGWTLPPSVRAHDAIEAENYLRSLPNVAKGRIGLIGFSHGANAALAASALPGAAFGAVVAFYPLCTGSPPSNALILIGSADDWTPASRCTGAAGTNLKVYPGATHAFDAPRPDRTYFGHHLAYDAAAAADAIDRTHRFLSARLGR